MFRRYFVFASLLALSACAYATEKSYQDLSIQTLGAHNTVCDVYVDGLRYQFYPPQKRTIFKSQENLEIDCKAPGNRRKKVIIHPRTSQTAMWNATNGMLPGMAWDYTSGALFAYPEEVVVDFTHMKSTPNGLPAQNQPDIKQPEEYDLEEFRAGAPRMNADKYEQPEAPRRRQPGGGFEDAGSETGLSSDAAQGYGGGDKGDLMRVIRNTGALPLDPTLSTGTAQDKGKQGMPVPLTPQSGDAVPYTGEDALNP